MIKRPADRTYLSGAVPAAHIPLLLQRRRADKGKEAGKSMHPELEQLLHTQKTSLSNRPSAVKTHAPCPGTAAENLISPNPHQGTPSCSPDSHTYN